SSDVCSSDLAGRLAPLVRHAAKVPPPAAWRPRPGDRPSTAGPRIALGPGGRPAGHGAVASNLRTANRVLAGAVDAPLDVPLTAGDPSMPTSPTRRVRRGGALLSAAVLLGACQWGLTFTPGVATQGGTVTVSNEGGEPCPVPDGPPDGEGGDVAVFVVSSAMAVAGELPGSLEDLQGTSVHLGTTDPDGFFSLEQPTPEPPGHHLALAIFSLTPEAAREP